VIKTLALILFLFFSTSSLTAAPPNPHTFVPNRGIKPSQILAANMKANISNGVRDVIYVWNQSYTDPSRQILDLMKIFKTLSDSPVVPKQLLMNQEYELKRVLDTKKMLKVLERFQKDTNQTYRLLFDYMSLIIGSKEGSLNDTYKKVLKEMKRMVKSYNRLAQETNRQYRQKVMPYYKLNYKKR
jgi:hypothetical protein